MRDSSVTITTDCPAVMPHWRRAVDVGGGLPDSPGLFPRPMRIFAPILNILTALWRRVRALPHAGSISLFLAVIIMLIAQAMGYHESRLPWMPSNGTELMDMKDWQEPSPSLLAFYYLMPYLKLWALIGGIVYHIVLIRAIPHVEKLLWPTWIACGFLALWAVCNDLNEQLEYARLTVMGEPTSMTSYVVKLFMITLVCLTPAAGLSYYLGCRLMDRYMLRSFLQPLVFCFLAICMLWMMWDMLDSLRDFQDANAPLGRVLAFYISLVPYIFVETIWAVLLLSTLFTLMRMSRSNEIISMLGTGRSMGQVLRPVCIVATLVSLVSLAANYYWAPRAEGNRQAIMRALSDGDDGAALVQSLMYRDEPSRRTWFISSFPFNLHEDKIKGIEVFTEDEKGQLVRSLRAQSAHWWPDGRWSFYRPLEMTYNNGNPDQQIRWGAVEGAPSRVDIVDWPETPWSIISSSLQPDYMSVQELVSYLKAHSSIQKAKLTAFRTQLYHRFAYPMECFIAVLVAAPLGISFSRRGVLGGVAGAILALIGLVFLNQLFLSLGKGMKMSASLAVWMPHLIMGSIGLILFTFRARNRDLPSLSWILNFFKPARRTAPLHKRSA